MCSLYSQSILQTVAALGELSSKQTDYFLLRLLKLVFKASTFWAPSAVPNLASPLRDIFLGKISCKTVWFLVNSPPHRSHIHFPPVLASYRPLFGCLFNFTLLNLHLISHFVSAHLHRKPRAGFELHPFKAFPCPPLTPLLPLPFCYYSNLVFLAFAKLTC